MGKLIRDKVPEIARAAGVNLSYEPANDWEIELHSAAKMSEELTEVLKSKNRDELIEELGDLIEAVYNYMSIRGVVYSEVERARLQKLKEKGGFSKLYILRGNSGN